MVAQAIWLKMAPASRAKVIDAALSTDIESDSRSWEQKVESDMQFGDVLRTALLFGLPACVLLGGILLLMVSGNPRLMLQDYPKDVQAAVPSKTAQEKRQTTYWAIPFWLVLLGFPTAAAIATKAAGGGLFEIILAAFGVGLIVNLFDWLVLDWLVFCMWTPSFAIIPGTAGFAGYKDYGMHFRGFLIGAALSIILGVVIGVIVYFV
jgi:hypothetical protein